MEEVQGQRIEYILTLELGVEEMLLLSASVKTPSVCSDICLHMERSKKQDRERQKNRDECPACKLPKEDSLTGSWKKD